MSVYFFRSEPGAAELRRLARRESGRTLLLGTKLENKLSQPCHGSPHRLGYAILRRASGSEHFMNLSYLERDNEKYVNTYFLTGNNQTPMYPGGFFTPCLRELTFALRSFAASSLLMICAISSAAALSSS